MLIPFPVGPVSNRPGGTRTRCYASPPGGRCPLAGCKPAPRQPLSWLTSDSPLFISSTGRLLPSLTRQMMISSLNLLLESAESRVQFRAWISIERVGTSILSAASRHPALRRHGHLRAGFVQRQRLVERQTERGAILRPYLIRSGTSSAEALETRGRLSTLRLLLEAHERMQQEGVTYTEVAPRTSDPVADDVQVSILQHLLDLVEVECVARTAAQGRDPSAPLQFGPATRLMLAEQGLVVAGRHLGRDRGGRQAIVAGRLEGIVVARRVYQAVLPRRAQPTAHPGRIPGEGLAAAIGHPASQGRRHQRQESAEGDGQGTQPRTASCAHSLFSRRQRGWVALGSGSIPCRVDRPQRAPSKSLDWE